MLTFSTSFVIMNTWLLCLYMNMIYSSEKENEYDDIDMLSCEYWHLWGASHLEWYGWKWMIKKDMHIA